jgi:hypothetical protein
MAAQEDTVTQYITLSAIALFMLATAWAWNKLEAAEKEAAEADRRSKNFAIEVDIWRKNFRNLLFRTRNERRTPCPEKPPSAPATTTPAGKSSRARNARPKRRRR